MILCAFGVWQLFSMYLRTHPSQDNFMLVFFFTTPIMLDVMVPSLSSVGSVLAVNIQPSDDAFGRFGFPADSQSRIVAEQQGGTPVALTVTRQGGRFGDVSVYWSVSQSGGGSGGAMDISPSEGVLEFSEGQTQMDIVLTVNDDLVGNCLAVCGIRVWVP